MHELSIAVDLIEAAGKRADEEGASRVTTIYLRIGPLSGVVVEALESAFEIASEGTMASGARLDVEEVPIVLYCGACADEKEVADMWSFMCPDCGRPSGDIRSGRELEVRALEIE